MRRIKLLDYSEFHALVLRSDLRLMRAVVRAAEKHVWAHKLSSAPFDHDRDGLQSSVDAFNKGARK